MSEPPREVTELAARRLDARAARDFASSDALRDRIAELGWAVRDSAAGQVLEPLPPYDVVDSVRDLPDRTAEPDAGRCTVSLLAEGWPDDLRACVAALVRHAPQDVAIVLLDNGDVDGSGVVVHELAVAHPGRVTELHVRQPAGWGAARQALLAWDTAAVHVLMDPSTVLLGDALTPLLTALEEPGTAAAGWRGVKVRDGWTEFDDAPPGEVEALLGYLLAVRRKAAARVPISERARYYRNADIEWSFLLRDAGTGRLVAMDLPVRQDRHRGYHETDPDLRDRESRRTYDRFLRRFRGREDLRIRDGVSGMPSSGG